MRAAELISCCQRPSLKTKHKCYKQTKLLTAPLMYHGIRGLWVIERSLEINAAGRLFRVAGLSEGRPWLDSRVGEIVDPELSSQRLTNLLLVSFSGDH